VFGIDARHADEADALAIAVCHLSSAGSVAALAPARRHDWNGRGCARTPLLRPAVRRYGSAS